MKPILIIPVDSYFQHNTEIYNFVLKVEDVNQIQKALDIVNESERCLSIQCDLNNIDVVSLLKMNIQSSVNIYINCVFSGDLLSLLKNMESSEKHKQTPFITYLFPVDTPNLTILLKILSSCGYKSGLQIDWEKSINPDDFIELATYSYLSPVPHAQIEPFGFIKQEICDKKRFVDINKFYYNSPIYFAHILPNGNVYVKSEFPELNKLICNSLEELSQFNYDDISMEYKKLRFYNHFDVEDKCSKCANFKICSGIFLRRFNNCQETMSNIYEILF